MNNLKDYADLEPYFDGYGEPWEVWEGSASRKIQRSKYAEWIIKMADWKRFVTLTFRVDKEFDVAKKYFYRLMRELNEDLFGKRYFRIVGKSYFSYVVAAEFQIREVIHFHFIADKPINFGLTHRRWNELAGFAHTSIIRNKPSAVRYIVKYVVKSLKFDAYQSNWNGTPVVIPKWWKEDQSIQEN